MSRVLIVGCGQLGSRHLQAVSRLPHVQEIEVVDTRPEALQLGHQRLAEVTDRQPQMEVRWYSSLSEATPGGNLCIVATQAPGRCQLVREVAQRLDYTVFLLEKIVSQSVGELEELMAFSTVRGLSVCVNLKGRAYPFHTRVKQLLDPADPILFSVVGGNHGLATNGIHVADLFAFYDGSRRIELAGSHIDPILHHTKRGMLDLNGTLQGYTEKGSHFTLSYAADHTASEQLSISTRRYRCIVDHLQRWAVESDTGSGWAWRPIPYEGDLLVSDMTKQFAADLLRWGRCELPSLEASFVAHRFILEALKPYFSQLLQRELESCPVT